LNDFVQNEFVVCALRKALGFAIFGGGFAVIVVYLLGLMFNG
jgi:hypothetical protein